MDSVIGFKGSKWLLTFIHDRSDSQAAIDIFNSLEKVFGIESFRKIFGIILTDNGNVF